MPIPTGHYFIVNVQTKIVPIYLIQIRKNQFKADSGSMSLESRYGFIVIRIVSSPFLMLASICNNANQKWIITERDNGHHTIQNIGHKQYAASGSRSQAGEPVRGREKPQTWLIQKTTGKDNIHTKIFWGLVDGEQGTPIALADAPTNQHYWWMFKDVETGSDATLMRTWITKQLPTTRFLELFFSSSLRHP
ncbi:hypothetical protein BJ912DRAFT_1063917 [Pholiota molesta]|nr:hypothetical protein BJ912DRAFT_1063917 [Pholiota molesta]